MRAFPFLSFGDGREAAIWRCYWLKANVLRHVTESGAISVCYVTLAMLPSLSEPQSASSHDRSCLQAVGRVLGDPGGELHTGCGRVKNGETSCFSLHPPPLPVLLTDLNCTVSPPPESPNQASPESLCPEA